MSASSTSRLLLLLVLLALTESRPSRPRDDTQVLEQLFGAHLSSLIQAPPLTKVTEGSADSPAPFAQAAGGLAGRGVGAGRGVVVPRYFLDFLQRQRKFRGRSRKSTLRGCFGMKVDRIGSISGLGC